MTPKYQHISDLRAPSQAKESNRKYGPDILKAYYPPQMTFPMSHEEPKGGAHRVGVEAPVPQ